MKQYTYLAFTRAPLHSGGKPLLVEICATTAPNAFVARRDFKNIYGVMPSRVKRQRKTRRI